MSWMDSWSRPSKSQATPAPFYLLPGGESTPYCHSCGRVIGSRKTTASSSEPPKYCSSRCRSHKPGNLDRKIEQTFVQFLTGQQGSDLKGGSSGGGAGASKGGSHKSPKALKKQQKGDPRILVSCDMIENFMFGDQDETTSQGTSGSEEHGKTDTGIETEPRTSESDVQDNFDITDAVEKPYVDGDVLARMSVRSGTRIRPPQSISEVNGSVGGEKGRAERIEESEEMLEKRIKGQKRAKEREMVRCAARRGVIFGFVVDSENTSAEGRKGKGAKGDGNSVERRKCEAVMLGKVVEPSFAKGDWCIRWRE